MLFAQTRSMMAGLVTLVFAATLLVPCFCATAFAADTTDSSGTDCCPESGELSQDDGAQDHDGDQCCCDGLSACGQADANGMVSAEAVLTPAFDKDHNLDGPTTWWTPDLVAALWVIDRLAASTATIPPPEFHAPTDRPDRSDTYLKHSTFLI